MSLEVARGNFQALPDGTTHSVDAALIRDVDFGVPNGRKRQSTTREKGSLAKLAGPALRHHRQHRDDVER